MASQSADMTCPTMTYLTSWLGTRSPYVHVPQQATEKLLDIHEALDRRRCAVRALVTTAFDILVQAVPKYHAGAVEDVVEVTRASDPVERRGGAIQKVARPRNLILSVLSNAVEDDRAAKIGNGRRLLDDTPGT